MSRPGGNPNIVKNPQTFKTDRLESLTEQLQLRITPTMKRSLEAQEGDWREFVREAIAEKLARITAK